jgi:hypothetical protein
MMSWINMEIVTFAAFSLLMLCARLNHVHAEH